MKVLFATDYKNTAKEIMKLYKKTYKINLKIDVSETKKETFKMLKENLYDVVLLKSSLDGQAILFSELEYIVNMSKNQRIIYLVDETCNVENVTQLMYEIKLYDGILEKDSTNTNIVTLINRGRTRSESQSYYNASDDISLINPSDCEVIEEREVMILLEKISQFTSKELVDYLLKLENLFDKEQLEYLYSKFSLDIRSRLIGNDLYEKYTKTYGSNSIEDEASDVDDDHEIYDIDDLDELEDDEEIYDIEELDELEEEEIYEIDELDELDDEEENSQEDTLVSEAIQDTRKISNKPTYSLSMEEQEDFNSIQHDTRDTKPKEEIKPTEPTIIERIVEVEKVVEKLVEVEKLIEVEKLVEIEKVVQVEKVVEVEKLVEVEKIVEKIVQVEKNIVNRVVIGVMGVKAGIGTTYHALSLAKTLSQSYKVAIVEFKNDFNDIGEAYEVEINNKMFTLDGIDYFSVDIEYFYRNQLDRDYNYIIVDFGAYTPELIKDYYRTNIRLMICGSQPWEDKYLGHFLTEQQSISNVKYIFNLTNHNKDIVENMPGLQVHFAPYFNNVDVVENLYKDIVKDIEVTQSRPVEVETKKKGFIPNFLRRG
ncbi:MAG: hypothetical protein ACRDA5_11850 [Clostridium sp.]